MGRQDLYTFTQGALMAAWRWHAGSPCGHNRLVAYQKEISDSERVRLSPVVEAGSSY